MKKIVLGFLFFAVSLSSGFAQVINSKRIDNGGNGPYESYAATEKTLPNFVVYRPVDLLTAVETEGKLPLIVFANGECRDASIRFERMLTEIASHGYVVIALGALQAVRNDRTPQSTKPEMLLEAVDWMTARCADKNSEYYQSVDLNRIVASGQSCGGAQVLSVAADPRFKLYIMFNSGMGDMKMAGASAELLKTLHAPIAYFVGGESDVAQPNALKDFERIKGVPVVFADLKDGGHMGTYETPNGGSFARLAVDWLDWQMRKKVANKAIFLENQLNDYPGWTIKTKNFQ